MEAIDRRAERPTCKKSEGIGRLPALIVAVACALAFSLPSASHAATSPKIRVRVLDGAKEVRLRGFDLKFRAIGNSLAPATDEAPPPVSWGGKGTGLAGLRLQQSSALGLARRALAAQADRASEWKLTCPNGGVVHAEKKGDAGSAAKSIYFPGPVSVESPSGFLTLQGKPFRQVAVVHPIREKSGWECEVVNHIDIEDYLDGLVNMEFSAKWSREAIDAQVVAARTYAYHQMKLVAQKKPGAHFDLDSDIKDQVYDGSQREDYRSRRSANRTRGMILKAKSGDSWPIKAYYHSTCGGRTELPEIVWGSKASGFRTRVDCPYCKTSPSFVWDVPLSGSDVATFFLRGARTLGPSERDAVRNWPVSWERDLPQSRLLELYVSEQNASGRAERVVSKWKNREGRAFELAMPGTLFRQWIGASRLKSTVFQVYAAGGESWVLRGRGFGHGVGLCQWGAKVQGEMGKTSRQILRFYYPNAVLARAW
jgi:stage II sporulation protein D